MEQEQTTTENTVEWNDKIIKFHAGINAKELIHDAINREDSHVYSHNNEYRNRKKQIVRWSKKYDNKIKAYVNELSTQPRMIKGTYKEHDYIIYLGDHGYWFNVIIKCLSNEVGGIDFNIFWKENTKERSLGDYGDSHRNNASYDKDSHSIHWHIDTKICNDDDVYDKFKDEERKEKGSTYTRSYGGLVTIDEVVPFVNKIIDDFIKLQGNDYKERAREFRNIHYQLSELKKLFVNTPDEDYQAFNCFSSRFNEKRGRTEEITNAISKNLYDKLFTMFNDMPLSVQNTFYKESIELMLACIVAKTHENSENLNALCELERKLEDLK